MCPRADFDARDKRVTQTDGRTLEALLRMLRVVSSLILPVNYHCPIYCTKQRGSKALVTNKLLMVSLSLMNAHHIMWVL